jgi:HEPN domain-containing protein
MFESYVELAREDLDAAKTLVRNATHAGRAAFYVEQAAEKLIKAVLSVEEINFTASHHQLGVLARLLPEGHEWRSEFLNFDEFTTYATKFRYPTASGKPPVKPNPKKIVADISQVAAIIDEVLEWCRDTALKKARKKK